MSQKEVEAVFTLWAWYEQYKQYQPQMPELGGVYAEIERFLRDASP